MTYTSTGKTRRKEIKNNRLKSHFLYFCEAPYFHSNLTKWTDYDPSLYLDLFLRYQAEGGKKFSEADLENIHPLIYGQKLKEITINSLIFETMDWDSRGWGWIYPINHALSFSSDRLFRLALLRIKRRLQGGRKGSNTFMDRLHFYMSHPMKDLDKSAFDKCLNRYKEYYKI